MGKRTAQKDAIKDITSDSQVYSRFPYRWPPASLTLNIYFYLFLYQHITSITKNNGTPHLKPSKNQNRRAALRRPAIKLRSTNPRPYFCLGSSFRLVHHTIIYHHLQPLQYVTVVQWFSLLYKKYMLGSVIRTPRSLFSVLFHYYFFPVYFIYSFIYY